MNKSDKINQLQMISKKILSFSSKEEMDEIEKLLSDFDDDGILIEENPLNIDGTGELFCMMKEYCATIPDFFVKLKEIRENSEKKGLHDFEFFNKG